MLETGKHPRRASSRSQQYLHAPPLCYFPRSQPSHANRLELISAPVDVSLSPNEAKRFGKYSH